jgi:hypothetical protein
MSPAVACVTTHFSVGFNPAAPVLATTLDASMIVRNAARQMARNQFTVKSVVV